MTSKITSSYRVKYWMFFIMSILLNIGPLAFYAIKALIEADLVHEKVTLCMTVIIVLMLTICSLISKHAMRSRLWIILIGIYICLDYIMTPLIIIACCQVVDELIVSPLAHRFKEDLSTNKQIDRRF